MKWTVLHDRNTEKQSLVYSGDDTQKGKGIVHHIVFLKKQHLSMFASKRNAHKEQAATLYREFLSGKKVENEDKWQMFSEFYLYFAQHFPAEIYAQELLVGTNWHWKWQTCLKDMITPRNSGHYIADFADFLQKGIRGKIEEANQSAHKTAVITSLTAFSTYIRQYADAANAACASAQEADRARLSRIAQDCAWLAENPPTSFRQALQFVWFIQCFLETEAGAAAISFGRADVYLYPYYQKDMENGTLTPQEAKKLIMCFYIKISEGDESTMLTVGGDVENELTSLFIEAQTQIKMRQPSIALRISKTTSSAVWDKATQLVLNGSGMPAYFNDDVIMAGLKMLGADDARAADYGIVGCYEAAPQGAYTNTVAGSFNLYDSFQAYLETAAEDASFDDFLKAYKRFFEEHYQNTLLPRFKATADYNKSLVSPFASCVLDCGKFLFGIDILGIGLLIDSLYTIKKLVFEQRAVTISELMAQAEKDFEDIHLYSKILALTDHYGSNSEESNRLAREITEFMGQVIRRHPIDDDVISSPALFLFTGDIYQRDYHGTVNGRKKGELLSYGVMPCATPHKDSLTSILMSCAHIAAEYFPDGCPAMVSMNERDIRKDGVLEAIIKTFFEAGGYHLAVNTVNANLLEEARKHPEEHADILVKISGYSTQFTTLGENIQNAVIERAQKDA